MKFGKTLKKTALKCNPEWDPFWLNYKLLKKQVKNLQKHNNISLENSKDVIGNNKLELSFFAMVRTEVKKIDTFYETEMQGLDVRCKRLKYSVKILDDLKNTDSDDSGSWFRSLKCCSEIYKEALDLEQYSVTQYAGLRKILKKHDKNTGFITMKAFMENVESTHKFVNYEGLVVIMNNLKELYEAIQTVKKRRLTFTEEDLQYVDALLSLQKAPISSTAILSPFPGLTQSLPLISKKAPSITNNAIICNESPFSDVTCPSTPPNVESWESETI